MPVRSVVDHMSSILSILWTVVDKLGSLFSILRTEQLFIILARRFVKFQTSIKQNHKSRTLKAGTKLILRKIDHIFIGCLKGQYHGNFDAFVVIAELKL